MLRVNVGLSRKLSKDYNSAGYSINLEGEITVPPSDPEGVVEQVKELFDLAEEALNQQIDRSESDSAIAAHDEAPRPPVQVNRNGNGPNGTNGHQVAASRRPKPSESGNGHQDNGQEEQPATNKQIQYLLSIGKRLRMTTVQLEKKIAEIIGRPVGVYDLSKMAAGIVIEALSKPNGAPANGTKAR
jgi:hypothetical protein